MTNGIAEGAQRRRALAGLAASIVAVLVVSVAGGVITAGSVDDWYLTLAKPSFNPPGWVFGPVWTVLYLLMAVAAWRVWLRAGVAGRGRTALTLYAVQLILNFGWTLLFFGAHLIGWALAELLLLLAFILATGWAFARVDRLAAALLAPYGAWVAFAVVLNTAIVHLN